MCASSGVRLPYGRPQRIMTQLTLKRTTSEDLLTWKKTRDPAVWFPGSRWTICHIISTATRGSTRVFSRWTRRYFQAKRGAVRDPQSGHSCDDVAQTSLAVRSSASHLWIQHSHAAPCIEPAVSFPLPVEGEFRLAEIQPRPGPETETVWRTWTRQEPQQPAMHARGRCCVLKTVTKR